MARACDTCERHSVRKRLARRNARETRAASTSGACRSRVDFRLATINRHRRSAREAQERRNSVTARAAGSQLTSLLVDRLKLGTSKESGRKHDVSKSSAV